MGRGGNLIVNRSLWLAMVRILISISGLLLRFLLFPINQNAEKLVLFLTFCSHLNFLHLDPAYSKNKVPL